VDDDQVLPEYRAFLIAEQRQVFGPRPIVWLYNQLTGGGGGGGSSSSSSSSEEKQTGSQQGEDVDQQQLSESNGTAVTRIYLRQDDATQAFSIGFDCTITVTVKFPKFLLRILPASKEKMEEQGSAAVQKSIEKDIRHAVETSGACFERWKQQQSVSSTTGV